MKYIHSRFTMKFHTLKLLFEFDFLCVIWITQLVLVMYIWGSYGWLIFFYPSHLTQHAILHTLYSIKTKWKVKSSHDECVRKIIKNSFKKFLLKRISFFFFQKQNKNSTQTHHHHQDQTYSVEGLFPIIKRLMRNFL